MMIWKRAKGPPLQATCTPAPGARYVVLQTPQAKASSKAAGKRACQEDGARRLRPHQGRCGGRSEGRVMPGLRTSLQYLVTATAKGCSLLASAVPTTARTFLRGSVAVSMSKRTRMTLGTPWVMVPVLSNITVLICQKQSHLGHHKHKGKGL